MTTNATCPGCKGPAGDDPNDLAACYVGPGWFTCQMDPPVVRRLVPDWQELIATRAPEHAEHRWTAMAKTDEARFILCYTCDAALRFQLGTQDAPEVKPRA